MERLSEDARCGAARRGPAAAARVLACTHRATHRHWRKLVVTEKQMLRYLMAILIVLVCVKVTQNTLHWSFSLIGATACAPALRLGARRSFRLAAGPVRIRMWRQRNHFLDGCARGGAGGHGSVSVPGPRDSRRLRCVARDSRAACRRLSHSAARASRRDAGILHRVAHVAALADGRVYPRLPQPRSVLCAARPRGATGGTAA
jgi:hypothetical protein